MYMDRVLFAQVSNREDFISTTAVFDDISGQPINLAGTILANAAVPFTASSWNVVDGPIVTTSNTTLTIPVPPIGSQLLAVTLTVAPSLNIALGDPVKISDTATGLNQMLGYVTGYAAGTGRLVCQVGVSFQFEIRGDSAGTFSGYSANYDWGLPNDQGAVLRATLGNGITIVDVGFLTIFIPEITFRGVLDIPFNSQSNTVARTLMASLTMTDTINTRQLYIGRLPILFGGVTQ
jgi:hypothetical protein